LYRSITPPNKKLKVYTKISLDPNQLNLTRITESGHFTIRILIIRYEFCFLTESNKNKL